MGQPEMSEYPTFGHLAINLTTLWHLKDYGQIIKLGS